MRDSVTTDEFVSLPGGLQNLQAVDFRSAAMNPPFFRSFAALPLLLTGPLAPRVTPSGDLNDWATGYRFMQDYGTSYHELFVPARCMVILTAVLLTLIVSRWATEIYGWPAGLVALFLFAFSPVVLAQAHLVTLDLAGAPGWTAAAYLTWRLLLANLLALGVLNGLYRFEGFAARLGDVHFDSKKLLTLAGALPWLRLPLPLPFLRSLDALFVGDRPTEPAYYLAGSWSLDGWWYYHFVAFALKTPLPLLASGLFAVAAWAAGRSPGRRDYCVIVPILCVFVANSLMNPLNIGVRHVLPVYPLLAIAASPWLAAPIRALFGASRDIRDVAKGAASIALLGWFLYGNVSVAPRYLEYFNELAGGPANGHRWLVDSNLDWGQDLIRLSSYMRERHLDSVHLAYFGRVDPRVYGIDFTPIVEGESHGIAVVSASFLVGRPYPIWKQPGTLAWSHHGAFTWLQRYPPVARVGSMFVFDLP